MGRFDGRVAIVTGAGSGIAGTGKGHPPVTENERDEWDKVLAVNLIGTMLNLPGMNV